jgi:tetratricopeptide (TPR) repeat protein
MKINKKNSKEYLLAVECFKKNDFDKTIEICKKIVVDKKNNEDAHYLLALALTQHKNYTEAFLEIEKALKINKNKIEFIIFKGNLNREVKNYEQALLSFQKALKINRKNTDALYWTAVTMYQMGQKNSALNIVNNAISIEENSKFKLLKVKCLEDLNLFKDALIEYNSILEKNPLEIKALLGKGDLLRRMFKYELALEFANIAMKIESKNINCYLLKSVIYKDMQNIEESLNVLNEGLDIKPNSEQANFNKSIILLQSGKLKKGWELYEWRWRVAEWTSVPLSTSKPAWNGEKDVVLYIWPEQGIGDEVMFASIFNDLKKDVDNLIIKIDYRLIAIYERSFPNINFVSSNEEVNDCDYDFHLPIGSLPKFYRNILSDFNDKNNGYLKTNKLIECNLRHYFTKYANKRKIGISWKSKNPLSGMKRSAELEDVIKYINDNEAVFVNLQYGDVKSEIEEIQKKGYIIINIEEIDNMKDIDGLLSIINLCDEIVSIDNSTVHFAGAIGKKTEVLMHESADFRWEIQGNTSKWYKSLSLKRNIIL